LAIMPPTVARLAVEMSGAKRSPSWRSAAFNSSSTMPGSTRAQRSAAFTSRRRLRYFDVSTMTPLPMACPACDVPPPRIVSGHRCALQAVTVRTMSSRDFTITTASGWIW
jgi:hypothetical protein